jgi:membrane protein CcdC involved in cytochrome C biogenesis
VALARASLWLLLTGVLLPEAVMLMVFAGVWSAGKVCGDFFVQIYHGCVPWCCCWFFMVDFVVEI